MGDTPTRDPRDIFLVPPWYAFTDSLGRFTGPLLERDHPGLLPLDDADEPALRGDQDG